MWIRDRREVASFHGKSIGVEWDAGFIQSLLLVEELRHCNPILTTRASKIFKSRVVDHGNRLPITFVGNPEEVKIISAGLSCFGSKLEKTMTTSKGSSFEDSMFVREFVQHEPGLRGYARTRLRDWYTVDEGIQEASVVMRPN